MKTTKSNWRLFVSISELPKKMLLVCAILALASIASAQTLNVTLTPFEYNGGFNVRCNGQNNGRITAVVTGGTAPYTYAWSDGVPVAGGTLVIGLSSGTTSLTVTDAAGTTVMDSVTLTQPAQCISTTTWSPIQCYGGTSTVTTSAVGGTPPYNGITSTVVPPGVYEYVLSDANGCRAFDTITITQPDILDGSATAEPILCFGDTTSVTVTATGGTLPITGTGLFQEVAGVYSYDLIDANGCTDNVQLAINQPNALNASISATPILCNGGTSIVSVAVTSGTEPYTGDGNFVEEAGWHTYTVYDFNLCSDTIGILVTEPDAMVSTITATPILCNGGTSTINVTGLGGTGAWTGTGTFTEPAGTYGYSFTDANGCTDTNSITVTEPAALVASATSTPIDCNGGSSTVTITATGGTAPYVGIGDMSVSAGTHDFVVTDANGCSTTVSVTVTEPTALIASATSTPIACNGGSSTVTVTATGGTAPYVGTGDIIVPAGTHAFVVTDANGCSTTVSITVSATSALVASATATAIACNGGTADITVSATGGSGSYTGTGTFTVGSGTFDYTVTDANGCTSTVSITVTEPSALTATATVGSLDCASLTSDVTIVATGGTAPYSGTGVIGQGVGTTTYTITDANGCSVTVSATVEYENFVDLTCPGDQTYACNYSQSCGSQNTGSIVSWDEPTASSFNTCDNGCGPNTQIAGFIYMGEYNGSRYYCSNTSNYSWQAANTAAINAGGHLATIQSAGENQFISSQIMANVAWIGLNDQNVEGTFEWANGENVGYTNWGGYEPNNNGPVPNNCTYCGEADYTIISSSQGGWYDRYECNLNEFVMEVPCGNPITITQTSGPANGSFIAGGTSEVVTYVATDDVTGATATCSFTVNVEKCTPTYCESEGYCTAYEWIDQVALGSINNQSGNDNGYGDYTTLAAGASVGDVINLTLTPGFSGQSYTEAWRVWIDWNYDGDFYDQGEMVYQGYGNSAVSGSFTVPAYATVNEDLRVRVSMRWNCYPGPCSTFQYGEVEDYTIFVIDNGGIDGMTTVVGEAGKGSETNAGAQDNVKSYEDVVEDTEIGGIGLEIGDIYPNPVLATNGEFNVEVRVGHKSDVTVRIVDLSGKVLLTDLMHLETGANKRTMDVTGFARGSYIIEVISGDLKETTQLIVQ